MIADAIMPKRALNKPSEGLGGRVLGLLAAVGVGSEVCVWLTSNRRLSKSPKSQPKGPLSGPRRPGALLGGGPGASSRRGSWRRHELDER